MVKTNWDERTYTESRSAENEVKQGSKLHGITKYEGRTVQIQAYSHYSSVEFVHLVNPLDAELNPICHLLALVGAHHILHVSGVRVTGV